MKLAIFNGSPRHKKSNTKLLLENFTNGYSKHNNHVPELHYLANQREREQQLEAFNCAEFVIIALPLYTDSMPGIVKAFIESLPSLKNNKNKSVGFIVQSGFPESIQSSYLERYLRKMSQRLGFRYLGTVIKGGVEGIHIMPSIMTRKLFDAFVELGSHFAQHQTLSPKVIHQLATPVRMGTARRVMFRMFQATGLTNFYWNEQLKRNNAMHKRFDQPYLKPNADKQTANK